MSCARQTRLAALPASSAPWGPSAPCARCALDGAGSNRPRSRASQAGQLPAGPGQIRHDLQNAETLLRGGSPVPGLGGAARQVIPQHDEVEHAARF